MRGEHGEPPICDPWRVSRCWCWSTTSPISSSTNPEGVQSEFVALMKAGLTTVAGEAICSAHHGLSLLVTARAGGAAHTVLFDTGPEGYAIQRNGALLGADLASVESVVLSHGHWDHCGGAATALELVGSRRRGGPVPVYTHPGMFRSRARRMASGDVVPFKPIPSAAEMTELGASVVATTESSLLHDGHFYVSGEIPRVTAYERGLPDHLGQGRSGLGAGSLIMGRALSRGARGRQGPGRAHRRPPTPGWSTPDPCSRALPRRPALRGPGRPAALRGRSRERSSATR